jgi:Flp pilus assembly pilin Flp
MRTQTSTAADTLRGFARRDEGQDLLEYGLLASLIATFVIGALTMVGDQINDVLWASIAATRF